MALRIVSGLLIPASDFRAKGEGVVVFRGHSQSGTLGTPDPHVQRSIGPDADFLSDPCFTVSLREIVVRESPDRRTASNLTGDEIESDHFRVNTRCFRDRLVVSWEAIHRALPDRPDGESRSEFLELSYMVIGEA